MSSSSKPTSKNQTSPHLVLASALTSHSRFGRSSPRIVKTIEHLSTAMAEKSVLDQETEFDTLVAEVQRSDMKLQQVKEENQLLLEQNRLLREKMEQLTMLEQLKMEQSTITFPRGRERDSIGNVCVDDDVSADNQSRCDRLLTPLFGMDQQGMSFQEQKRKQTSTNVKTLPFSQEKNFRRMEKEVTVEPRVAPLSKLNHPGSLEGEGNTVPITPRETNSCDPGFVYPPHSKPNIIPDRFDGKTPWKEYIGHFEACRMANAWDEVQAKVFLAASLRGPALKTLSGKINDSSNLSYKELVDLLEKRFDPGQLAENYLLELRYRRQGPKETIQELGQAVRELSMLAYPELPTEAQDRLARTHFTEAIDDQAVREGVFRSKPISMDEAIQAALATDNFYRLEEQRAGRRYKLSRTLDGSQSTEIEELKQELKWIRQRLEYQEQASGEWSGTWLGSTDPMPERRCYRCNESGHLQRNCPQKRRKREISQPMQTPGNDEQPTPRSEGRLG